MPTFTGARLPAARKQEPHEGPGQQELRLGRHPDTVTSAAAVKDLLAANAEPRQEMLEVGSGGGCAAEHGRIEWTAPRGEQPEGKETTADLEAAVGDVLVRHAIAGEMERRSQEEGERA
jgi:hypothetical protein